MNKTLLIASLISVIMCFGSVKLYINKCNEFSEMKGNYTQELIQFDSVIKTHVMNSKQLNSLIIKKDSTIKDIIDKNKIEINRIKSLNKIYIKDTIKLESEIIKEVQVKTDTVINFNKEFEYVEVSGFVKLIDNKLSLYISNITNNDELIIIQYEDVTRFYQFKKRRELGYNAIGFRRIINQKHIIKSKHSGKEIESKFIVIKN